MKTNLKIRSGNKIAVVFDGKTVGAIKSVSMNDDYSPEPATEIGSIHVIEYVPTVARHSLSVNGMLLYKGALIDAGIVMENGDAMLQGLVFDFEVYGKDDGALLRKYVGVSYASGSIEIQANAIVVQSGQFNALDVTGSAS